MVNGGIIAEVGRNERGLGRVWVHVTRAKPLVFRSAANYRAVYYFARILHRYTCCLMPLLFVVHVCTLFFNSISLLRKKKYFLIFC